MEKITKEQIAMLPLKSFDGEVIVITNEEDAIFYAKKLITEKHLGFDTETKPSFKKGEFYHIAMIQLATATTAYIFRINFFKMPTELVKLFTSKDIIKTGVAIRDDIKGLQKLESFEPNGFIELADMAKDMGAQNFGLRPLAAIFMKIRVSKGAKLTNWEQKNLNSASLKYAATDAWVSREIYTAMINQ